LKQAQCNSSYVYLPAAASISSFGSSGRPSRPRPTYTYLQEFLFQLHAPPHLLAPTDMNKRTIPEGSDHSAVKRIIVDEAAAAPDADWTAFWAAACRPAMDRYGLPDWIYRGGRRYAHLQCRMRHAPGTCKFCAIVIE